MKYNRTKSEKNQARKREQSQRYKALYPRLWKLRQVWTPADTKVIAADWQAVWDDLRAVLESA